jgi:Right handed beta helix region
VEIGSRLSTIQSAVTEANYGDTIQVAAGTYTEQVSINKNLTLVGMGGRRDTIIEAPATLAQDWRRRTVIVEIGMDNPTRPPQVTMRQFTVRGPGGSPDVGIGVYGGANLELSSVDVIDIRPPLISGFNSPGGTAIGVGLSDNKRFPGGEVGVATITDVSLTNYGEHGITVFRSGSRAHIENNHVTGHGSAFQAGIMVGQNATATIVNNDVIRNIGILTDPDYGNDPINQAQSVGIGTSGAGVGSHIVNNRVLHNDVGIYQYFTPGCATTNNVLRDNNFYGLVIQNGTSESINDTISGGEYGIAVVADEIDTRSTIQNAKISGYDSVSREVREIPVSPCTVTVQRRA